MGLFRWLEVWTKQRLQGAERPGLRIDAPGKSRNGNVKSARMRFRPHGINLVYKPDCSTRRIQEYPDKLLALTHSKLSGYP